MLFRFKNSLWHTLLLTFALFMASIVLYKLLNLNIDISWTGDTFRNVIISLVVLLIGDGVVQAGLRSFYGKRFQETFDTFLSEVVVGEWEVVIIVALTAATEEMFFRGGLGQGMLQLGWGPVWAVLLSSFIFSFSHYFKRPGINMWLLTSIWEGLALGITYVLTGSLITIMVVHGLHDVINGGVAIVLVDRIKRFAPQTK